MKYVDTVDRTFTTRLEFIHEIFSNKFAITEILTSSINYKLISTLEQLQASYDKQINSLQYADPVDVLEAEGKEK